MKDFQFICFSQIIILNLFIYNLNLETKYVRTFGYIIKIKKYYTLEKKEILRNEFGIVANNVPLHFKIVFNYRRLIGLMVKDFYKKNRV